MIRFAIAAIVLLSGAFTARAQDTTSTDDDAHATAAARALFQEGVTCADRGDWSCAVDRFGRARALRASPAIVSNQAVALTHLGRLVEASESYHAVLRDPSASAELRAAADRGLADVGARIAQLTVRTTGPIDGITFSMDGHAFSSELVGVGVPVDPGDHLVEARRAATVVASAHVHVDPAARRQIELALPEASHETPARAAHPAPAPAPAASSSPAAPALTEPRLAPAAVASDVLAEPPPTSHHEVYEEWWFWTIVGVAAVGAGAGITAGVISSQSSSTGGGSLGTIDGRP